MTNAKHPWVEDYTDFEAVLKCVNELPEFNPNADLRAFQTFGWDDASTPGNDRTFAHAASGVMVRYEGSFVAIEYSGDHLTESLEDLFRVLSSLGWRLADVYHPLESMSRLMADMGRAIPVNLDFDLRAASGIDEVSSTPDGVAMIAKGMALMGTSNADEFNAGVMAEFSNFGEDQGNDLQASDNFELTDTGTVFRVEESNEFDDFEFGDSVHVPQGAGGSAVHVQEFGYDVDETPRVFYAPGSAEALAQTRAKERVRFETHPDYVQNMRGSSSNSQMGFEQEQPKAATAMPCDAQQEEKSRKRPITSDSTPVIPLSPDTAPPADIARRTTSIAPSGAEPGPVMVKVGLSVFCFDRPSQEATVLQVAALAEKLGAADIVHLRPGASGATIRWDVLGEIDDQQSFMAEKVAAALSNSKCGNALLAATMLGLRKSNHRAQLRSVVESVLTQNESSILECHRSLVSALAQNASFDALREFLGSFGALLLCDQGDAFTDLGEPDTCELFTVRGVMRSSKVSVYVVHVDSLDCPFVENIADALQRLVQCYEGSKRHADVVTANREVSATEQLRAKALHLASVQLASTLKGLQDMGLSFPAV